MKAIRIPFKNRDEILIFVEDLSNIQLHNADLTFNEKDVVTTVHYDNCNVASSAMSLISRTVKELFGTTTINEAINADVKHIKG